ncbi:kinase-like domain-containing protein [Suillus lakei]|nr:kinase-like domain-containing protein [Suillus lakei]
MGENVLEDNTVTIRDFASQIKLESPVAHGSFGDVYRCVINEGKTEVAVKVFNLFANGSKRPLEKLENALRRELMVWLKLSKSTYIVPLLGVATFDSPLSALVSEWIPAGTLSQYLEKHATTLAPSARVELTKGIAGGVNYLRSENVIHGDLHPGNVLIDGSGNPRLTDFGLATVVGDPELQLTTMTLKAFELNSRWRAPEVIGIDCEPGRPTFKSDIYSLGSVIFFVISGDIPWKEKKRSNEISIELSRKATPTRSESIPIGLWNLIQKCWSWEPGHRPEAEKVLEYIDPSVIDNSQASISNQPVDLTGQINGQIKGYVAGGAFANVFKCECKQPTGPIKVAVKVLRFRISQEELEKFHREIKIWAVLEHDHIVRLLGTAREFGSSPAPALVFPWFEITLRRIIEEQGASLSIESKLHLLLGTASGLEYLHGLDIVHGDITSSNVLVDIQAGKYRAYLTDVGLATVLGGRLSNRIQGSSVRLDAIRWTAPELLNGGSPTKENDMYSFGYVMFHVLTLDIPWHTIIEDCTVLEKSRRGECISRPAASDSPDVTTARWNEVRKCWSTVVSRPSASMVIDFLKSELEAFSGDLPLDVLLFGETGVDKSSIINLIVGKNIADAAPNAPHSTLSMGFFRRFIAKWQLRASYRRLHRGGVAPLLLYCMRGPSAPTASRDYQDFTDIVGSTCRVSTALVVNGLEQSLTNMDDWWTDYEGDLERLGMQFFDHACVTSLPNDPNTSQSREIICSLIESYVYHP